MILESEVESLKTRVEEQKGKPSLLESRLSSVEMAVDLPVAVTM